MISYVTWKKKNDEMTNERIYNIAPSAMYM